LVKAVVTVVKGAARLQVIQPQSIGHASCAVRVKAQAIERSALQVSPAFPEPSRQRGGAAARRLPSNSLI